MLTPIDKGSKIMLFAYKLLLIGILNMANSPQLKTEHN